ncbi:MAG: hypothetical protein A2Y62_03880 [Candidatus Fischerbacteria bacterium RBG_13_37_8]|uniref:Archaeal glycosylation protein B peripheral domain-containing protein n=1 Tax=Candidatus Fischerbacteria bacterium RBG_13_37_8 TaxID=1817863 RepID=A0A1F5V5G2_9BACT|nr:MAG: hypothetical protein A2Y62_03880 [Candidatus Fischerbacteria bacterium RBG_13_37_8]
MSRKKKKQLVSQQFPESVASPAITAQNNYFHKLLLVGIILLAICIRIILYWQSIVIENKPFITDSDVTFHLRRAEICMQHYPWIPVYNSYEEYPIGSYYESPPLHAFIMATIAFIVGGFKYHSSLFTMWILIFLPPLMAGLSVWLIHLFAKHSFHSLWIAYLSALFVAVLPINIQYSHLGNIDHHVTDYCGIILYFLVVVKAIEKIEQHSSFKTVFKIALLPGFILALAIYIWQASFLHGAIVSLSLVIYYMFTRYRTIILFAGLHFLCAAFFLLPGALYTTFQGVSWNSLAFFSFGQVFLVLAIVAFFIGFYLALNQNNTLIGAIFSFHKGWAMVPIMLLCLYPVRKDIIEGIKIMIHNPNPWLRSVTESTPILFITHEFSIKALISTLSLAGLIAPFLFILIARKTIKQRGPFSYVLICVAAFIYGILTHIQARFGYPFSIPLSLITAYSLVFISTQFLGSFIKKIFLTEAVIPIFLSALLLIPCATYYGRAKPMPGDAYLKDAYEWIKKNTPVTSYYDSAQKKPEYAILADWDFGIPIEYYSHRPTIIDARGPIYTDWSPVARFLLSESEVSAELYRAQLGIRYVMLTDWFSSLRIYPSWIHANWNDYFRQSISPAGEETIYPTETLMSTLGFQLTELSGNARIVKNQYVKPALQHYRLVWESSFLLHGGRAEPTSAIKLFEQVKGAKLECKAPPGKQIKLTGMIITNIGRTFLYQNNFAVPDSGIATIYLPYPTERKPSFSFVERYYIQSGNNMIQLQNITEHMVLSGETILVSFQ